MGPDRLNLNTWRALKRRGYVRVGGTNEFGDFYELTEAGRAKATTLGIIGVF